MKVESLCIKIATAENAVRTTEPEYQFVINRNSMPFRSMSVWNLDLNYVVVIPECREGQPVS